MRVPGAIPTHFREMLLDSMGASTRREHVCGVKSCLLTSCRLDAGRNPADRGVVQPQVFLELGQGDLVSTRRLVNLLVAVCVGRDIREEIVKRRPRSESLASGNLPLVLDLVESRCQLPDKTVGAQKDATAKLLPYRPLGPAGRIFDIE